MSTLLDVINQAMELPVNEQRQLILELSRSLDTQDTNSDLAWQQELRERILAADRGEFAAGNWQEILQRAESDEPRLS